MRSAFEGWGVLLAAAALTLTGAWSAFGQYASTPEAETSPSTVPPVALVETVVEAPSPTRAELAVDLPDAVRRTLEAAGLAGLVPTTELDRDLAPSIVRVLVDAKAVLIVSEVPADGRGAG